MLNLRHPNIVAIKEVIREENTLFFVMEYMSANLYECMKDRAKFFSEDQVRNIMSAILNAIDH